MIRKILQLFKSLAGAFHNHLKCTTTPHNNTLMPLQQKTMREKNRQQEILVFMETSFVQNVLMKTTRANKKSVPAEQLEDALWNGMLNKILPELMIPEQRGSEISIWQICTSECSLLIDLAEAPDIIQDSHSICVPLFISKSKMN